MPLISTVARISGPARLRHSWHLAPGIIATCAPQSQCPSRNRSLTSSPLSHLRRSRLLLVSRPAQERVTIPCPSKIRGAFAPKLGSRNHMPDYEAPAPYHQLIYPFLKVPSQLCADFRFPFLLLQNFAKFCCKNVNSVTKFTVQHSGALPRHKKTQVALHLSPELPPKGQLCTCPPIFIAFIRF